MKRAFDERKHTEESEEEERRKRLPKRSEYFKLLRLGRKVQGRQRIEKVRIGWN